MSGLGEIRANRRIVFHGLGALGVAAALAGCGGGDDGSSDGDDDVASGTQLTTTDEVPVGGGVVLTDQKIVVTQPTGGDFKAFSAICTHQNCPVTSVANGTIDCKCHGSKFSIEDGSVVNGPATSGLGEVAVTVKGNEISTA